MDQVHSKTFHSTRFWPSQTEKFDYTKKRQENEEKTKWQQLKNVEKNGKGRE